MFTVAVAVSAGGACGARAFPGDFSPAGDAAVEQAKAPDAFGEFPGPLAASRRLPEEK